MRALKVRHEPLPGIGELLELRVGSGRSVRVVSYRSGKRELSIASQDVAQPEVTVTLTRAEAAGLAALLVGAHVELITERDD